MACILGKELLWENIDEADDERRRVYAKEAQNLLAMSVWQNETKKLMDTLIRSMATDVESYDQLRDIRMCVSALKLIDSRLKEIASWDGRTKEPHDAFGLI